LHIGHASWQGLDRNLKIGWVWPGLQRRDVQLARGPDPVQFVGGPCGHRLLFLSRRTIDVSRLQIVAGLGLFLGRWYRNPLRRQMRTQPIAFRTELSWVKFPERPWNWVGGEMGRRVELIIRGDIVRVGAPFGLVIGPRCYFRAPETTIELSRNPMRIYGIYRRREWIVVRGGQDGREFELSMTRKYFLEDVWNALAAAGAVPTSGGPSLLTQR
jgi:hypothetical protein